MKTFVILISLLSLLGFAFDRNSCHMLVHSKNEFGEIWVFDCGVERNMTFKDPETTKTYQGRMNLSNLNAIQFDTYRLILSSLFLNPGPKKVLHLGLGTAIVPRAMRFLFKDIKQDVVEINPAVKEYASKYFYFDEDVNTKIHLQDAFQFVKTLPDSQYDIVFFDAFGPDGVPPQFLSKDFGTDLHRILKKNGVAVINMYGSDVSQWKEGIPYAQCFQVKSPSASNTIHYMVKGAAVSEGRLKQNAFGFTRQFHEMTISASIALDLLLKGMSNSKR